MHVVLSIQRWMEMRPALRDLISNRLELRLGDPGESEFEIRGQLWSQPIPLQLYLRTEIDLENGDVSVKELRELGPSARRGGD